MLCLHCDCRNPGISRRFDFEGNFFLVQEFCEGGELYDEIEKLTKFTEKDASLVIKQILGAVSYCHDMGIVHRDLKPENIMMEKAGDPSTIKIIDFGGAKLLEISHS